MTRRASRIVAEAHKSVRLPWSGTFHCAAVGLNESFSVLDRGDAADLMDVVRHELGFSKTEKRFPRKDTCVAIYSHRVNTRPAAAGRNARGGRHRAAAGDVGVISCRKTEKGLNSVR